MALRKSTSCDSIHLFQNEICRNILEFRKEIHFQFTEYDKFTKDKIVESCEVSLHLLKDIINK
jgi:hypothetical protein